MHAKVVNVNVTALCWMTEGREGQLMEGQKEMR
jgi:hypothetical protein